MAINDTRIKISIVDNATNGIRNITSQYAHLNSVIAGGTNAQNRYASSVYGSSVANGKFATGMVAGGRAIDATNAKLLNAEALLQRVTYSAMRYFVVYKGFTAIGSIWDSFITQGYQYSKMIETNRVGMAGILTSMTAINGKQTTFNQALSISTDIMSQLRSEALRTSATSEELIDTFRGLLGPGIGAGMKIDEIVKLTTVGVNAVKSLGLPKNQLLQELRGMVQGGIKPASSTLATALGLKDKDIQQAKKSSEGLFVFLMKRLKGFEESVGATGNTFAGRLARIQEAIAVSSSTGGAILYDKVNTIVGQIADNLILIKKGTNEAGQETKKWVINPALTENIEAVAKRVGEMYDDFKDIYKVVEPIVKILSGTFLFALETITAHIKLIAGLWAGFSVVKIARDISNVHKNTDGTYQTTTKLGKAYQEASDKLTGMTKRAEILKNLQANTEMIGVGGMATMGVANVGGVSRLSQEYQKMGIEAGRADKMQQLVLNTLFSVGREGAMSVAKTNKEIAEMARLTALYNENKKNAGVSILGAGSIVDGEIANQKQVYNSVAGGRRAEESVTRLAERYTALGVEASKAMEIQTNVQRLVIEGNTKQAEQELKKHNDIIRTMQLRQEQSAEENNRHRVALAQLNDEYLASQKLERSYKYVTNIMAKATKAGNGGYSQVIGNTIVKLTELGIKETEVYELVKPQARALAQERFNIVEQLGNEIVKHAELTQAIQGTTYSQEVLNNRAKEYASIDYSKLTTEQMKLLQFDSEHVLALTDKKQAVNNIRNAYIALAEAQKEGVLTSEQHNTALVELQQRVATGYVDIAGKVAEQIVLEKEKGTLSAETAIQTVANLKKEEAEHERLLNLTGKEINERQRLMLEFDAQQRVALTGNRQVAESLENIISINNRLIESEKQKGRSVVEIENAYVSSLQKVITAKQVDVEQTVKQVEANVNLTKSQLQANESFHKAFAKIGGVATSLSMLGMVSAQYMGENEKVISSISTFIFSAGIMVDSIGSVYTALKELAIQAGITKGALFGVVSGIVAVVGATAMKAKMDYDNYNKGGKAVYDENGNVRILAEGESPAEGETVADNNTQGRKKYLEEEAKAKAEAQKKMEETANSASEFMKNLSKLGFKEEGGGTATGGSSGGGVSSAQKQLEAEEKARQKMLAEERNARADMILSQAQAFVDIAKPFGERGCTAFLDGVLNNTEFADLFDNAGLAVDVAWQRANQRGIAVAGTEGMQRGDTIFYASNQYKTGSHVGVYDGQGGVYHNSSSQGNKAYHQTGSTSMGNGTWIMGYARTGSAQGSGDMDYKNRFKSLEKMNSLYKDINNEILKAGGSTAYDKVLSETQLKIAEVNKELAKVKNNGVDTSELEERLKTYAKVKEQEALRANREEANNALQARISEAERIADLDKGTTAEMNKELGVRLNDYKNFLTAQLENTSLTNEERIKMEQNLTNTLNKQREIDNTNLVASYKNAIREMANSTHDYKQDILQIRDSFENGFTNLMDGVATGQKTFAENIKSSWEDIGNTIINTIWKIAMEMFVVQPLLNSLGLGGGQSIGIPHRAKGGLTSGWALVGEQGPELVNFTQPGRVYTNSATKSALGVGQSTNMQNIRVSIQNETGTQAKVSDTQVNFDADGYIINVVLSAISTNKGGTRDILKGAMGGA